MPAFFRKNPTRNDVISVVPEIPAHKLALPATCVNVVTPVLTHVLIGLRKIECIPHVNVKKISAQGSHLRMAI